MFDRILAPITQEEFFAGYWTKQFLHVPGIRDKFSDLFPWQVLTRALEEHRFDSRRLGLVKSGNRLDGARYLNGNSVNSARLTTELANGATLILNSCDELHRPLRELCVELERLIHQHVTANLYAGWRRDNGFDVHWDTQDVIILQVSGRKHWKVWAPTRLYPFKNDAVDTSAKTKPEGEPVWDGILEPGSLLSIPRGWWHVAFPLDEPCLHLTVTILNLNGIDLLHWLAEYMKTSDHARMELPVVADPAERGVWLRALREHLLAAFDDRILDRFLADADAKAVARPELSLPLDADPERNVITRDTLLVLAGPRPMHFFSENGGTSCSAAGVDWAIDSDIAEKLAMFNDGIPHSLAELASRRDLRMDAVIGLLVTKGVLRRVR